MQLADRQLQIADVAERDRRDRVRAGLQPVDVDDRLLEPLRRQLDGDEHVGGGDRERERQPALPLAGVQGEVLRGAGRHRGGAFDERADEHGDERPGAVVGGVRVGAQRRIDRRDRQQRLAERRERDRHGRLVARARLVELVRAGGERVEQLGADLRRALARRAQTAGVGQHAAETGRREFVGSVDGDPQGRRTRRTL